MGMVGKGRKSRPNLIRQLLLRGVEFEFFQAVQILECHAFDERAEQHASGTRQTLRSPKKGEPGVSASETKPLGTSTNPRHEVIRFKSQTSRSFPAGDISSIRSAGAAKSRGADSQSLQRTPDSSESADAAALPEILYPVEITVPFMGLMGPTGVLPEHYSNLVIERSHLQNKDYALREFFDLFNHRAITLFYLAWRKHRVAEEYQRMRREGHPCEDRFTAAMLSIVGFGLDKLRNRHVFSDEVFLSYGGLFSNQRRTAIGLKQMLTDFLGLQVAIREFCGRWLYLPADIQSSFPSKQQPTGLNLSLGKSTVAGSRVWDRQSTFRVTIGPLNRKSFEGLLPGTPGLKAIEQMVRTYAGVELDFEIQLILRAQDIPACQLQRAAGGSGGSSSGPCLGWTTWVGKARIPVDSGDAVFRFSGIPSTC